MKSKPSDSTVKPGHISGWWTSALTGPVIAAAVVRFTLLAIALARSGTDAVLQADTNSYLIPGRNLLFHGRFFADGVPDVLRTPGYPLFLALTSFAGLPAAAVANVLVSVFSVILVWKLGQTVTGNARIALGAAWIFAFEPLSVASSASLMSETLFLALFLLSLERLAEFLRSRRLRVLAVSGLWLTAATFVRPVTYYLPVAVAVGLFVVLHSTRGLLPRKDVPFPGVAGLKWKAPALFLICTLPWLAAWQIRNKAVSGYSGFSSVSDVNLYFFVAGDLTARTEQRPFANVVRELGYSRGTDGGEQVYLYPSYLSLHPEQSAWTQAQRLAFLHSAAASQIRAHSGVYLRTLLPHIVETVFDPGAGAFNSLLNVGNSRQIDGLITYVSPMRGAVALANIYPWIAAEKASFALAELGLYLLAAWGALRGNLCRDILWLMLGISLYFVALSAVAGGAGVAARYRLPVMPVVCLLAAAGAVRSKTTEG